MGDDTAATQGDGLGAAIGLEYVASGAYSGEPSFQRFLHAKTERMRSRGERVDLWN